MQLVGKYRLKIRLSHLTKEEKREWMPGTVSWASQLKNNFFVKISHTFCYFLITLWCSSLCSHACSHFIRGHDAKTVSPHFFISFSSAAPGHSFATQVSHAHQGKPSRGNMYFFQLAYSQHCGTEIVLAWSD